MLKKMRRFTKIGYYAEEKRKDLDEKLRATFGEDGERLFLPILRIEGYLLAAVLLAEKIIEIEDTIADKSGRIDADFYAFDNPKNIEWEAYKYFFFCCCGRVYGELRLIGKYIKTHGEDVKALMEKIRPLKDIRDLFEHGDEDAWKIEAGELEKVNWKNYLRKGGVPKITGTIEYIDFTSNIKLIEDLYGSFTKMFLGKNESDHALTP